jgi:hypothetical protein
MRFDLSQAWQTLGRMIDGFAAMLPRLLLAAVLVTVFVFVARGVRAAVRRRAMGRGDHRTLELAIGRLAQAGIVLLGSSPSRRRSRRSRRPISSARSGSAASRSASRSRTSSRTSSPGSSSS